jgi:hypothetical protein
MRGSGQIKVLSCIDVSDEYVNVNSPYERIFVVEYVKDGKTHRKTIIYNYKTGFSPSSETRLLQERCLELNTISRYHP